MNPSTDERTVCTSAQADADSSTGRGIGSDGLEPHLMAILANRVNAIARHMTHVLTRSARSSVMSACRDLSTAICDARGDALALPNGFPVHVANMSLVTKSVMGIHGDSIAEGDAFLHNSPYHGNTHMADHTVVVPVYHEGELLFFCTCRGHQADIGNSSPTTYDARAADIYEEGGLCFPCVRVQKDYDDIDDIVRMAKSRIRVPEVWYGDYLAAVGAARIGERSLKELVGRYGVETMRVFAREWQEYGRRCMVERIRQLPAGTWHGSSTHDGIPGLVPEIAVEADVTIDPVEGRIIVDYTNNGDPVPCGLNLCEATVLSAGRTGIMNRLRADVPLCEGAMSRIDVRMKESGVVGKATLPHSSSAATTDVADRAILAVQNTWASIEESLGMAEGAEGGGPQDGVISGFDSRAGRRYVTQLIAGDTGGGASYGHDGYVDFAISNGAMQEWNSIEVVEQKYPIVYLEQQIIPDSPGAGQWDGAPGCRTVIAALEDDVTFMFLGDNAKNPPRGANGGGDGIPTRAAVRHGLSSDSPEVDTPLFSRVVLKPGQSIVSDVSSGGGYGDPLCRDPEMVRHRVAEGWLSAERALTVYGVALAESEGDLVVDGQRTASLRQDLKKGVGAAMAGAREA